MDFVQRLDSASPHSSPHFAAAWGGFRRLRAIVSELSWQLVELSSRKWCASTAPASPAASRCLTSRSSSSMNRTIRGGPTGASPPQ